MAPEVPPFVIPETAIKILVLVVEAGYPFVTTTVSVF